MDENSTQLMLAQLSAQLGTILTNQAAAQQETSALRADFNNFARDIGAKVATHDTQLHALCGNGQPGEVAEIKADLKHVWSAISRLRQNWKYALGVSCGSGTVVAAAAWAVEVLVKR